MVVIIFLVVFLVYLHSIAPTVALLDTGDMITSSFTGGIPHPPGYPLFCILGKVFSYILPIGNIGYRYNLLSALFGSLACTVVAATSMRIISLVTGKRGVIISLLLGLILGFSEILWYQSTIAEKYSQHAFFSSIIIFLFVLIYEGRTKLIPLFFFVLGMSFSHHLQTIFLLPLGIYLFLSRFKESIKSIPYFFIPIFLYLYLPIRANNNPELNWGNPYNLEYFINHVKAAQYKPYLKGLSIGKFFEHIKFFWFEFSYLVVFGIIGIYVLLSKKGIRILTSLLLVIIAVDFLYSICYDIPNIRDYYLPAYIIFTFFIGAGIIGLIKRRWLCVVFLIISAAVLFYLHYSKNNKRLYFYGYDYGRNILHTIEKNGIILSEGDDISFPIWYLQNIEFRRPDIDIISVNFLQYDWYIDSLEKRKKIKIFYKDPQTPISPKQRTKIIIDYIISHNASRPIYAFPEYIEEYPKIPAGVFYKLKEEDIARLDDFDVLTIKRGLKNKMGLDYRAEYIIKNYAIAYSIKGSYFYNARLYEKAELSFKRALAIESNYIDAVYGIGLVYEKQGKDASCYYKKVLELDSNYYYAKRCREYLLQKRINLQ